MQWDEMVAITPAMSNNAISTVSLQNSHIIL